MWIASNCNVGIAFFCIISAAWINAPFVAKAQSLDSILNDLTHMVDVFPSAESSISVSKSLSIPLSKRRPDVGFSPDPAFLVFPNRRLLPPTYIRLSPMEAVLPAGSIEPTVAQEETIGVRNILLGNSPGFVSQRLADIERLQPIPKFDPGCLTRLAGLGVEFEILDDEVREECAIAGAVRISSFSTIDVFPNGSELTCDMAERMARWLQNSVQSAAYRHLGQPVEVLQHYSTYSCRRRSGGRISEHGFANAIDIAVFKLADGRRITLEDKWASDGTAFGAAASNFLREIGSGACADFQVVLTPDSDAAHYNHFHFDAGRWKSCG